MRWKENMGIGLYAFLFMVLPFLLAFCINDGKRETWQDCAGVNHPSECDGYLGHDYLDCEYEFYKECINE